VFETFINYSNFNFEITTAVATINTFPIIILDMEFIYFMIFMVYIIWTTYFILIIDIYWIQLDFTFINIIYYLNNFFIIQVINFLLYSYKFIILYYDYYYYFSRKGYYSITKIINFDQILKFVANNYNNFRYFYQEFADKNFYSISIIVIIVRFFFVLIIKIHLVKDIWFLINLKVIITITSYFQFLIFFQNHIFLHQNLLNKLDQHDYYIIFAILIINSKNNFFKTN